MTMRSRKNGSAPPRWARQDAQPREALEHAAVDETHRGQRGVERKADDQVEAVVVHLGLAERIDRVEEDRSVELLGPLVERPERLVVERRAVNVRADGDAGEAQIAHGAVELDQRGVHVLERQRCQTDEAVRMRAHDLGDLVVPDPCQPHAQRRWRPVEHRRPEREHLAVHAEAIHLVEARRRVVKRVDVAPVLDALEAEERRRVGGEARAVGGAVRRQLLHERARVEMRVDVDDQPRSSAR